MTTRRPQKRKRPQQITRSSWRRQRPGRCISASRFEVTHWTPLPEPPAQ
ncbi:MAG: DUF551 domain-containing protein [Caulobacteraceae bacterium]|nr:DUF551 domain-containing protein [Caulobacteraceae bacterium]